jgi:hypothetical protein
MAGPLPLHQIKSVIEKIRTCRPRNAPRLKEAADRATELIETHGLRDTRPYAQGNALAFWLRRSLELSSNRAIDLITVLERQFNVDVRVINFGIPSLEAVAVWGPKNGPGVLLNRTSRRIPAAKNIWRSGALRVSASHELCHLLMDSRHTLSAVDILGGRMPVRIEQRAKAFAAELLLPSKEAGDVWRSVGYPLDLETLRQTIKLLCYRFNVTMSVAAWQLQHGASEANWEELDLALNQIVPHR